MPDWVVALVVVLIVLVVVALFVWWWMNRRNVPAVVGTAAAPAAAAATSVPAGPYGPGSAAPLAGGAAPNGFTIKGNADSMLFHTPESPYYTRTIAEVWFRTAEDAEKAGFKAYTR